MRWITTALTLISLIIMSGAAICQDDEIPAKKAGDANKATSMEEAPADETPSPVPADDAAPEPAPATDASFKLDAKDPEKVSAKGDAGEPENTDKFVGVKAPNSWHQRDGFGVYLGLGSLMCTREYCNSVIDVNLFGSITGTLGGFYRLNPNLVFFVDTMIGHMNTNMAVVGTTQPTKDNGTLFTINGGAEFHLPIVGWFDPYIGLGLGYALMMIKAEASGATYEGKWHGFNIEPRIGADMFLWSTGFAKNLSIGAVMKVGFPVWPKLCVTVGAIEDCGKPSELIDSSSNDNIYESTPFTFQMAVEARYHF